MILDMLYAGRSVSHAWNINFALHEGLTREITDDFDPTTPCPRCTLADTPTTRNATKARIGPWYVLQARNPAAPGMKFETLAVTSRAYYNARLPLLLRILPLFIVFSVVICYVFNLTTTKWRFISLPDALNIMRVASILTVALIVLDYAFIFAAPSGKAPLR